MTTLPQCLQADFAPLIIQYQVDEEQKTIVKAANTLAAYITANDELRFSN